MIITARIRRTGKVIVSVCLSVHTREGGTHLYPIILPLVPCPFWGRRYPISIPSYFHWSHVLSRGYPSDWSQVPSGRYPSPAGGTQGQGTPPARDGVPSNGQGWGTPRIGQQREYLICGMPLTFMQEDFLVCVKTLSL